MPDKGLWIFVVVLDEIADGVFQFVGRAMHSSVELLFGQQSKPAFNKVEPACRGRCEVQVETWSFYQPVPNQLRFVSAVVVQDQVYVQLRRYVSFNRVDEVAKLDGTMAALGLADQRAGFGVQSGEQAGSAVAGVVVRAAFDLAGTHGQKRCGSVQGLYLAFFIDA